MTSRIYRGAALALAITAAAATSALAAEYRVTGDIEGVFGASHDKSTTLGAGVGGQSRNSGSHWDIQTSSVADITGLRAHAYASA